MWRTDRRFVPVLKLQMFNRDAKQAEVHNTRSMSSPRTSRPRTWSRLSS